MPGVDGGRGKTYAWGVLRSGRQSRPDVRARVRLPGEQQRVGCVRACPVHGGLKPVINEWMKKRMNRNKKNRLPFAKQLIAVTFAICCCFIFTGCASILDKSTATVAVFGNGQGSTVTVKHGDDVIAKQSMPATLQLNTKQSYCIDFENSGRPSQSVLLSRNFNSQFLINVIFPLGFIADLFTGAWRTIDDSAFYVDHLSASGVDKPDEMHKGLQEITLAKGAVVHATSFNFNTGKSEYPKDCEFTITVGKSTFKDLANWVPLLPVKILSTGNLQRMTCYLSRNRVYKTGKTQLFVGAPTCQGDVLFFFDSNYVLQCIIPPAG